MSDFLLIDDALRAAQMGLKGLNVQQQAISRNIANVDTPGYQAQTVNFQDVIKRVMNGSNALSLTTTQTGHLQAPAQNIAFLATSRSGGTERADQNNVDIDQELMQMDETGINYQALSQTISKKLLLLKTIATDK